MRKSFVVMLLLLSGCASGPMVLTSPFERCVGIITERMNYSGDRLRAADWCRANDNGGIQ